MTMLSVLLLSGSCAMEEIRSTLSEDGEIDCVISFGSPKGASVDVGTKAELGIVRESNVFNIYLMIFDGNSEGKSMGIILTAAT